jgi:hypothetical protein
MRPSKLRLSQKSWRCSNEAWTALGKTTSKYEERIITQQNVIQLSVYTISSKDLQFWKPIRPYKPTWRTGLAPYTNPTTPTESNPFNALKHPKNPCRILGGGREGAFSTSPPCKSSSFRRSKRTSNVEVDQYAEIASVVAGHRHEWRSGRRLRIWHLETFVCTA